MIRGFRHKGLQQLFEEDNAKGVIRKIRQILALLDATTSLSGLDLQTYRLHPLKGDLRGFWSVTIRANWRIIFRFDGGVVSDVDFVDYHLRSTII